MSQEVRKGLGLGFKLSAIGFVVYQLILFFYYKGNPFTEPNEGLFSPQNIISSLLINSALTLPVVLGGIAAIISLSILGTWAYSKQKWQR